MDWQSQTLNYYDENAAAFIKGTAAADISSTRERFAKLLPPGARILDFGCGSGRDTKAFLELGFQVDATDGSAEICRQASSFTGINVQHMLFQWLDVVDTYDGIWACASILHLPKQDLIDVLHKICQALKTGGIFYTSFKYGTDEGVRGGRYFTDFTPETLHDLLQQFPELVPLETWITQDVRPGREEERWTNILARRA